jgi:hypothetical protein
MVFGADKKCNLSDGSNYCDWLKFKNKFSETA